MRSPERDPVEPKGGGLDARQWSAIAVVTSFVLGIGVLALAFFYGGELLRVEGQDNVETLIVHAGEGPWAPLWVMLVFSALALAGVPQFILIAATVVVFGPLLGSVYSWIATLASALLGFVLGRLFAQRMMTRYGGARLNRLSTLIARHGILSSALVRNVPSGPFIMVNVAAGATRMSAAKYTIGTAIGIVPKIAFIGLIGTGVVDVLAQRKPEDFFLLVAVLAIWIALGFLLKRYWAALTGHDRDPNPASPVAAEPKAGPPADRRAP